MSAMTIGANGLAPMAGRLRLTTRGRVVLGLLAALLAAAVLGAGTRADAGGSQPAQEVVTHIVAPGETLWRIAAGVAEPGQDVRDVILDVVELNRLPSSGLTAGQVIVLPAS